MPQGTHLPPESDDTREVTFFAGHSIKVAQNAAKLLSLFSLLPWSSASKNTRSGPALALLPGSPDQVEAMRGYEARLAFATVGHRTIS